MISYIKYRLTDSCSIHNQKDMKKQDVEEGEKNNLKHMKKGWRPFFV